MTSKPARRDACEPAGRSCLFDGSAANMAKKQAGKPAAKEKIQVTLSPDVAHKLRLAALAHRMDVSEFVTAWVVKEFSGLHIRGMNPGASAPAGAGQGGPPPMMPPGPSYVQNASVNHANDDDEEPVTAANVMSTLPQPTPGPNMAKRSKVISDAYKRSTDPYDAAVDELAG